MTSTVSVSEYESLPVLLDKTDAEFIKTQLNRPGNSEYSLTIDITPSFQEGEYFVNPYQYVGVAELPSGRILESRPKVPVENLFYMLAVSIGASWLEQTAKLDDITEIFEVIAELFASESEELLRKGIHREYQETEDNLNMVRGRIDFRENIRLNYIMRHRNYCRFDELTYDIPENQVIAQTANLLNTWNFRSAELKYRLNTLSQRLSELTPSNFTGSDVDRFTYGRMTEKYRPVHRLCRLLLDSASLSEHAGEYSNPAFFINMNDLYEKFLTQILIDNTDDFRVEDQKEIYLDETNRYKMNPDILLRFKNSDQVALVADCKYKKLSQSGSSNPDMYQVLSYCTSTMSNNGVLIYPLHEVENTPPAPILNTETGIRQMTIDLGGPMENLVNECSRLAERMSSLASTERQVIF